MRTTVSIIIINVHYQLHEIADNSLELIIAKYSETPKITNVEIIDKLNYNSIIKLHVATHSSLHDCQL